MSVNGNDSNDGKSIKVNRRELLKKSLQFGGAAYVAPMVLGSTAKLAAQQSGPNPECAGATCATFVPCAANSACVCVRSSAGGGFCVLGSTSCGAIGNCGPAPGYACPAGSFCAVDTCCGVPVCVSFGASTNCQTGPSASGRSAPTGPLGTTIGY